MSAVMNVIAFFYHQIFLLYFFLLKYVFKKFISYVHTTLDVFLVELWKYIKNVRYVLK